MVRVEAVPNRPGCRCVEVELPGETVSRLVPSELISRADLVLRALAQPDGQDDGGDTDQDAEHGQDRSEGGGCARR